MKWSTASAVCRLQTKNFHFALNILKILCECANAEIRFYFYENKWKFERFFRVWFKRQVQQQVLKWKD